MITILFNYFKRLKLVFGLALSGPKKNRIPKICTLYCRANFSYIIKSER